MNTSKPIQVLMWYKSLKYLKLGNSDIYLICNPINLADKNELLGATILSSWPILSKVTVFDTTK